MGCIEEFFSSDAAISPGEHIVEIFNTDICHSRKKGAGGKYVQSFSKISVVIIVLKAYWDAVKGLPRMLKKRYNIQQEKLFQTKVFTDGLEITA